MVAVPDPPRGVRNQVSQGPGDAVLVPGAVLGEGVEAAAGEGPSEGVEQGLPDGPGELSLGHDASPVLEPVGSLTTYLADSDQETLLFNTARLISYCGVFRGNYWIESSPGVFFAHIPASPSPGCPCPSDGSVQPTISDARLLRSMWKFTPCHGGDRSPEDPGKRNE